MGRMEMTMTTKEAIEIGKADRVLKQATALDGMDLGNGG